MYKVLFPNGYILNLKIFSLNHSQNIIFGSFATYGRCHPCFLSSFYVSYFVFSGIRKLTIVYSSEVFQVFLSKLIVVFRVWQPLVRPPSAARLREVSTAAARLSKPPNKPQP